MRDRNYEKQKRKNRRHLFLALFTCFLLFVILLLFLILLLLSPEKVDFFSFLRHEEALEAVTEAEMTTEEPAFETEVETEAAPPQTETELKPSFDAAALEEKDIYTFLQGPKAWGSKTDWSGSWCEVVLKDQEFSVFGCGLCDLANIYSTLTPYDCSPLDMYEYAQTASGYRPVSGFGAIDWPYLRQTLWSVGITSRQRKKDKTYEKFQESIAGGITAIVLVCSWEDDTYWHDVDGHYVNIWKYNKEDDTVFLADSGNPEHNRQRIPLRYIYDALKTSSGYQYLLITAVNEDKNSWKHDGINIKWKKPKYYRS